MKNVNFLLVAVTLFTLYLESSTAKIGAQVTISAEDTLVIRQAMKSSEAALPRAKKIAADAIPKATATDKITLGEIIVWLESLDVFSALVHKQIRDSIPTGYCAEIKAIILQIATAVKVAEETLEGFNKQLSPGKAKTGININVNTVISNAALAKDIFQNYVGVSC